MVQPIKHTREKDSLLEAVRDYYLNVTSRHPRVLTAQQEEYRQRLVAVWTLLCRYHSDEQARVIHEKNYKLSAATAYRDIRNAIELFGDVRYTEKAGRREILAEWCTQLYQRAMQNNDLKAATRAVENIIKLRGLDAAEIDAPDFERLQPSLIVAALPEGMEKDIQTLLRGGAVNLNQFQDAEIVEDEATQPKPGNSAAKGN